MLFDNHHRPHDYLRISLTDSCNLRCSYCMPDEHIQCMPVEQRMQAVEIETLARLFVQHGTRKIRLTGGEPLVRKDAADILRRLAPLPAELTITTNGVLADRFIDDFRAAGIRSLNVSLDTLRPERFFQLTRRDLWHTVWNNIQLLLREGFRVKVNVVAMKNANDDEIADFVALTRELPLHVRFIEFMPFDGNRWETEKVLTAAQMLENVSELFEVQKLRDEEHDTAKKYAVPGYAGTFAFISTMSAPFCTGCNRMRLTADGKMKNCLFSHNEVDLLGALRRGEDPTPLILDCLRDKAAERGGQIMPDFTDTDPDKLQNRSMIAIGG